MDYETTSTFIIAAESEFDRNPAADDNDEIDEAALGHDPERIEAAKKIRDLKRLLKKDSQVISEALAPPAHKQSSAIQHFVAPLQNLFTSSSAPAPAAQDDSTVEPVHLPDCPTGCPDAEVEPTIVIVESNDAPVKFEDDTHPVIVLDGDKATVFSASEIPQAEPGERVCCDKEPNESECCNEESKEKECCNVEPRETHAVGLPQNMEKNSEEEVNAAAFLVEKKTHVLTNCDEGELEGKAA